MVEVAEEAKTREAEGEIRLAYSPYLQSPILICCLVWRKQMKALLRCFRFYSFLSRCSRPRPIHTSKEDLQHITKVASLLRECGSAKALSQGKKIHDHILRSGLDGDRFLCNLLVQMYGKCGALQEAQAVFDKMNNKNSFTWNLIISACAHHGQMDRALQLFQQMPQQDTFAWTTMLSAYAQRGQLKEAVKTFKAMPQRDAVSWNAMISAYVQQRQMDKAFELFTQMPRPNVISWTAMICGYAREGQLNTALALFDQMPCRDVVAWNAMISAHAQHGQLDKAFELFKKMPVRDFASWNALIAGYAQQGQFSEASYFLHHMELAGIKPDKVTFVSILDACANYSALVEGKKIHNKVQRRGLESDVVVATALINMYGKCGNLVDALEIFNKMSDWDLVSWNALIGAYSLHGYCNEAFANFQSLKLRMMPSGPTFVSLLSVCNYAALENEGCFLLVSMVGDYHIVPSVEHFNCMIDLLGRAGQLDLVEAFLISMPYQYDVASWTALLGACNTFVDLERGRRVAGHILELDPEDAGLYVLLSNLYAAAGCVDGSMLMKRMKFTVIQATDKT